MIFLMILKTTLIKFIVSLQEGLFHVVGDYCDKGFTTQITFTVSFQNVYFCTFEDEYDMKRLYHTDFIHTVSH